MPPKHKRPKVVGENSRSSKRLKRKKNPPSTASQPIELDSPIEDQPIEDQPTIDSVPTPEPDLPTEPDIPTEPEIATDQDPPYRSVRFVSPLAEQNYVEGYAKRPVLCERGILLEQFKDPPCDLLSLINAKGWQKWVKFQHKAIIPLVKEFYSNASKCRDDSGNRCIMTEVRKVKIELRPSDIAEMFDMPREEPPRASEEATVDLDKGSLAKLITEKENAVWLAPTLPKNSLSPKFIILHRLLCSHFMPHAFTGSVSLKQAIFMAKMIAGVHIDLAKHIFDTMEGVVKSVGGLGGLPFGGFITSYLLKRGVKDKATYPAIHPIERISPASTRRSRGQLKRLEAPPRAEDPTIAIGESSRGQEQEREEAQPPARPSEEPSTRELYEMMKKMQERQEEIYEDLKRRQKVVYSGVMRIYDCYHDLDRKVNQLLGTSDEEEPQPREHSDPSDSELAQAEENIQKTLALWKEEGKAAPSDLPSQSEPQQQPPPDAPATEPQEQPPSDQPAMETPDTPASSDHSGDSTEAYTASEGASDSTE